MTDQNSPYTITESNWYVWYYLLPVYDDGTCYRVCRVYINQVCSLGNVPILQGHQAYMPTQHTNPSVPATSSLHSKMSSPSHGDFVSAGEMIEQSIFFVAQSGVVEGRSTKLLDLIALIPHKHHRQISRIVVDHVFWYIALNWDWFQHPDAVATFINEGRLDRSYPNEEPRKQLRRGLYACKSRSFPSQTTLLLGTSPLCVAASGSDILNAGTKTTQQNRENRSARG